MSILTKLNNSELSSLLEHGQSYSAAHTKTLAKSLCKRRAKTPFKQWLKDVTPAYNWNWPHLVYVRQHLEAMHAGVIDRLMIFLPPQHGKSQLATIRNAVWRVEENPSLRVIIGAYNATFAKQFGRATMRLAACRLQLSHDRKAADQWQTFKYGGVTCVGVGQGAGMPADLLIIDDPVRDSQHANSEAYREHCWDWYANVLLQRLQPGGQIILTMTRWHQDDLAGRLLVKEPHKWTVCAIPGRAEDGDPLGRKPGQWLYRFSDAEYVSKTSVMSQYEFQALYQQRPAPLTGNLFRRDSFRYYKVQHDAMILDGKAIPRDKLLIFGTMDLAISQQTSADFSVISTWGMTPSGDLLLLDVLRKRLGAMELLPTIQRVYKAAKMTYIGIEKVQFQEYLIKHAIAAGLTVKSLNPLGSKVSRAIAAIPAFEQGKVWFPATATWLPELENELLLFPNGQHDDQVDTVSYAVTEMRVTTSTQAPQWL